MAVSLRGCLFLMFIFYKNIMQNYVKYGKISDMCGGVFVFRTQNTK
jgi:hypothetical protein